MVAFVIKMAMIIVAVLIKIQKHVIFVRTVTNKEDYDHDHNLIKTQKHVLIKRTAIMAAIFKNRVFL